MVSISLNIVISPKVQYFLSGRSKRTILDQKGKCYRDRACAEKYPVGPRP